MAVAAGADLVLELPFPYAASSARYFATAGVRALAGVGVQALTFGSECADLSLLESTARRTLEPSFAEAFAERTPDVGDAAAHFAALGDALPSNDILAVEYIRAILDEALPLRILPVKREGASYRDDLIGEGYPSATALRRALACGEDVSAYIPNDGAEIWQKAVREYGLADTARLGSALLALLRAGHVGEGIADCGGGLAAHLVRAAGEATDYASLCRAAATKRYTDGRIRRALLYLLAGVKREDLIAPPAYLRLLAANEKGREFLSETRKTRTVPVVTKQADVAALGESACRARTLSAVADGLFALCAEHPIPPAALSTVPPFMG